MPSRSHTPISSPQTPAACRPHARIRREQKGGKRGVLGCSRISERYTCCSSWGYLADDRSARQPVESQRDSRLPSVQRGHESAVESGRKRAHLHSERRASPIRANYPQTVLNHAYPCPQGNSHTIGIHPFGNE